MATGRRGNPVLRPYERQQTIGGQLSPRADVHYQKNYIGDALEKLATLTDNIYRSMEQDKFDKYERDINTAKEELYLKIQSTQDPNEWYSDYKAYKEYKESHGKELLGDTLYNKWLGDAKHGYGSAERDDLDVQMRIVPKVLENAKKLRIEDATQMLTGSVLESDPNKAKEMSLKAMNKLDDENLFTVAEREQNKNEAPKIAYINAYSSLLENSPDKALALVETKEFQDAIKDPTEIDKYRKVANQSVIEYRTNRDVQAIVQNAGKANTYMRSIMSGKLREVNTIENDPDLTRPQKDFLIKCMGERLSRSGKGSGTGDYSEINALTKIKRDFDDLFVKNEATRSGYEFRQITDEVETESAEKYNEIRMNKALELQQYIMEAWASGYISADFASTKLSVIEGTLGQFDKLAIKNSIAKEKVRPNAYYSGLAILNNTFEDYGIIDISERDDYNNMFIKEVNNYLASKNLTLTDFSNMPNEERDAIVLQITGNIKKDLVNYNRFYERIPQADGSSANEVLASAKRRYANKVKNYNKELKVEDWAHFSYNGEQEERLRDLASEAFREEINSVVKTQKSIESKQQADALLKALQQQENEEFLIRYTTAKEKELEEKRSKLKVRRIGDLGASVIVEDAAKKEYDESKAYLKLLKEGDEKTIQEALSNQTELENFIDEKIGNKQVVE